MCTYTEECRRCVVWPLQAGFQAEDAVMDHSDSEDGGEEDARAPWADYQDYQYRRHSCIMVIIIHVIRAP